MPEMCSEQRYERILQMIEQAEYEDQKFLRKLLDVPRERKNSFKFLIGHFLSSDKERYTQDYNVIIDAANEYIQRYPAPVSAKQKLYVSMSSLCEAIGKQFAVEDYKKHLDNISAPVDRDMTIGIIKALHDRDGVTKSAIAGEHSVSQKTVQTMLRRLSGEKREEPLRIGGQIVRVDIAHHKEIGRKDERLFYTPNSLSPVVFQLNIMKAAALLQSFQCSYEKGNNIPFDMALDTWYQLSNYAKERIREIYCKTDPKFKEFIDFIDEVSESDDYHFMAEFETESEMIKSRNLTNNELLMGAFKGGIICDLELLGPQRTLKRMRIFYDFEEACFYGVSADDPDGEKIYIPEKKLKNLTESS